MTDLIKLAAELEEMESHRSDRQNEVTARLEAEVQDVELAKLLGINASQIEAQPNGYLLIALQRKDIPQFVERANVTTHQTISGKVKDAANKASEHAA